MALRKGAKMKKELKNIQKEIEELDKLSNAELVLLERAFRTKVDVINILIEQRKRKEDTKPRETHHAAQASV